MANIKSSAYITQDATVAFHLLKSSIIYVNQVAVKILHSYWQTSIKREKNGKIILPTIDLIG